MGSVTARFGDDTDVDTRCWVAYALQRKGDALRGIGRLADSLSARDELIGLFREDGDDTLRTHLSTAFDRKSRALYELGRYDEQLQAREEEHRLLRAGGADRSAACTS